MLSDPAFWTGVVSGIVSAAIVAMVRGAGTAVLSWLGLARVGRAWGSKTTWRLVRLDDDLFHAVLMFCENPVTVTSIVPISGVARWAELAIPDSADGGDGDLPRTVDAGARLTFRVRQDYDEGLWLRGFVYEIAWFEERAGRRRGFRAKARFRVSEPPLTR
jgi:hypothetical protein